MINLVKRFKLLPELGYYGMKNNFFVFTNCSFITQNNKYSKLGLHQKYNVMITNYLVILLSKHSIIIIV